MHPLSEPGQVMRSKLLDPEHPSAILRGSTLGAIIGFLSHLFELKARRVLNNRIIPWVKWGDGSD